MTTVNNIANLTEALENLKVTEMIDLVKHLEEKWGVSASAPIGIQVAASDGSASSSAEKTSFNVVLTSAGTDKIGVIKLIRKVLPTLGLAEAKAFSESASPKAIKENIVKTEAEEIKKEFESIGAKVEIQ